ncbi:MAG TPA: glycoside hydrolase family 97 N-terminal domain-containing protein, partial [Ferruginibacter sp.]|nr:glycoside hydrolase family 97 N-terminal domain-containing protein [Ferruginibacter sp.]
MQFKKLVFSLLILLYGSVIFAQVKTTVYSPNKNIQLNFWLNDNGAPVYELSYKNREVIFPSTMGFQLKQTMTNEALPALQSNLKITASGQTTYNNKWKPVWGDVKEIRENYNQLLVSLSQQGENAIVFNIIFKVFDDGVGFRYEFPKQKNLHHFIVSAEKTEFSLTGDHKAFWIPGDYDSNEFSPNITNLSEVDALDPKYAANIFAHRFFDKDAVQTPLMMKTKEGLYINIHEAALVNYPAMNLLIDKKDFTLSSALVPDALGNKAYLQTPAKTPWRTILVSDKATEILASHTILNLNDPSVIKDPSWIKPTKYVGIWWEMHVGKASWDSASGKHGANTANVKRYIDFAAKHGFSGVLVEGWNVGWEDWFGQYKENV